MLLNYIQMDDSTYYIINGPLTILNLLGDLFFAYCLSCPSQQGIKQPLKILLDSLVCCSTIFLFSLIADECVWLQKSMVTIYIDQVVSFTAFTSMSTSVWLNLYYYTQIVPAQQDTFMYMKRNIKLIIYWSLFVDRLFFLFDLSVNVSYFNSVLGNSTSNYTSTNDTGSGLYYTHLVCAYTKVVYLFFCLCVMVGSSWATVCYLHGHIKNMKDSNSSFSSPNLSNQMRVTVTGVMQGVLYFLCTLWIFTSSVVSFDYNVFYTVISVYMFGTTVNLGIGQSVFRQRAANICLKFKQAIK